MNNEEYRNSWTYGDDRPTEPETFTPEPARQEPAQPFDRSFVEPPVEPPVQPAFDPSPKKKAAKKAPGFGAIVAVALCCALLGGIVGAVGVGFFREQLRSEPSHSAVLQGDRQNTVLDIKQIDTNKLMTPAEVYAANVNSTVGITTSITTNFWGYQTTSAASGSGFIISEDGYILTNHHVIDASSSITVSFYDGTSKTAELIGYDASNDIAVLKVEAENLSPVVLGDSDNMNVGDTVLAIGNPLGELTFSLTVGAVSALERDVTTSNGVTMALMQTDCAINSGNSGGALFNLYGEVIGITNAKYSSSSSSEASIDNIGFAIPLNNIRSIVEDIIEKGYVSKPYIGVTVADVSEKLLNYGLPKGASVESVMADSPAQEAGLQVGDIITHVDGNPITGSGDLVEYVGKQEIGDTLKLTVFRQLQGGELLLDITIGEYIQSAEDEEVNQPSSSFPSQGGSLFPFFGFGY